MIDKKMEDQVIKRRGFVAALCAVALCAAVAMTGCSSSETYVPAGKDPVITVPTIGEEGVLRVGVNASNPPLAGTPTSSDRIVGIDVDVAATLADELGLKLEIIDVGTSPVDALEQGEVDIVMGIDESNTDASVWKSDPYLPTATALFSVSASVPTEGSTPTIAASVSSESAWAVTNAYGDEALEASTNLTEAFETLASGSVDYVAADAVNGIYASYANDFGAQVIALFERAGGYTIGVLDSNSALKQAVSDALDAIMSGGLVSVVETQWLGASIDLSSYDVIVAKAPAADENEDANADSTNDTDDTETNDQVQTDDEGDTITTTITA